MAEELAPPVAARSRNVPVAKLVATSSRQRGGAAYSWAGAGTGQALADFASASRLATQRISTSTLIAPQTQALLAGLAANITASVDSRRLTAALATTRISLPSLRTQATIASFATQALASPNIQRMLADIAKVHVSTFDSRELLGGPRPSPDRRGRETSGPPWTTRSMWSDARPQKAALGR